VIINHGYTESTEKKLLTADEADRADYDRGKFSHESSRIITNEQNSFFTAEARPKGALSQRHPFGTGEVVKRETDTRLFLLCALHLLGALCVSAVSC
jgi:hypothetical protein